MMAMSFTFVKLSYEIGKITFSTGKPKLPSGEVSITFSTGKPKLTSGEVSTFQGFCYT